eukprot:s762_g18.t1
MIKAFAQSQKWQDALESLDWPFSSNDVAKKTTVLSACGRVSQWALLCLLADPKRQSEVVLSNVAINSLRWQDTCDIFASFALSSLKPDKISFQSTLSSCSRGRQWTIALNLHNDKTAVQSCAGYNVVVRSCGQEGKWRSAVAILQEFQLRRLSEQRHRKDAFGRDQDDKRAASLVTSTISGCERAAWKLVLSCLRHGHVRSDAVMLTAATKIAPWHASQTILTGMRLSEVLPDRFTFAAVTGSYESLEGYDALWEQAVQHLACSISFRITLDVATYNAVMNACAVCGEWWCVLRLLKSMRASQIQADRLSYDALATSLTKQSRTHWEQVLSLLEENVALQSMTPCQSLKLLPESSWAFALQIFDTNSMRTMRLHSDQSALHSWQLAFHASSEMPERVVREACHQRGWQWTVSALSLATESIESTEAAQLVSLTSLASAFTIANIWESVFMCIEKLQQLDLTGHNLETNGKTNGNLGSVCSVRSVDEICCVSSDAWPRALGFLSLFRRQRILQMSESQMSKAYNSLIASFAKSKNVITAKQLLFDMSERAWKPSTLACNILLAADEFPMSIFEKMLAWKLRPNVASYSTLISACEKQQDTDAALAVLKRMGSSALLPNVVACSAAISSCGGKWQTSMWLFECMQLQIVEQDAITYNAVISSCEKSKKADLALSLFDEMPRRQIRPTEITYNALISACDKCSYFRQGVDLLKDMNLQGLQSDVITFNALISSCSRLSRVDSALSLFRKMRAASIQPTSVTCSTLIKSCESGKRFATALTLFEDFQRAQVEGNLISYNAVISACGNGGLQKRALKVFEEMSYNQIEADACTYNSLIAAFCKVLALQEAWEFENEMCVTGVADMVTYIPFLRTEDPLQYNSFFPSYVFDALQSRATQFLLDHR